MLALSSPILKCREMMHSLTVAECSAIGMPPRSNYFTVAMDLSVVFSICYMVLSWPAPELHAGLILTVRLCLSRAHWDPSGRKISPRFMGLPDVKSPRK